MWSSSSLDLKNLDMVLDNDTKNVSNYEPIPYTFKTLENGKKTTADSSSLSPPSWILLDHTVAVIWLMFTSNPPSQQMSIEDLKWAYEFLKDIKNKKGENPPDVKVCLKKIEDRLINLYAKLTSLKQEDFDEIAAAFGDKIMADSTTSNLNTNSLTPSNLPNKIESKLDLISLSSSLSPTFKSSFPILFSRHSSNDVTEAKKTENTKHKRIAVNYSKKTFPLIEKNSNIFEEHEKVEDEEVEKYILSLFNEEKKEDLQVKFGTKSSIPPKRKSPTRVSFSEVISTQDATTDFTKNGKTSKKVRCVAELRSLKFQKSMKVQETIVGEGSNEAAYSNLKAEIRRLTINPNVSKSEIMKFLKEWRSEQVDRLHNELKKLNSIEEFIKSLRKDETEEKQENKSLLELKDLGKLKSKFCLSKSLLPYKPTKKFDIFYLKI